MKRKKSVNPNKPDKYTCSKGVRHGGVYEVWLKVKKVTVDPETGDSCPICKVGDKVQFIGNSIHGRLCWEIIPRIEPLVMGLQHGAEFPEFQDNFTKVTGLICPDSWKPVVFDLERGRRLSDAETAGHHWRRYIEDEAGRRFIFTSGGAVGKMWHGVDQKDLSEVGRPFRPVVPTDKSMCEKGWRHGAVYAITYTVRETKTDKKGRKCPVYKRGDRIKCIGREVRGKVCSVLLNFLMDQIFNTQHGSELPWSYDNFTKILALSSCPDRDHPIIFDSKVRRLTKDEVKKYYGKKYIEDKKGRRFVDVTVD